jgi:hypothetical protein
MTPQLAAGMNLASPLNKADVPLFVGFGDDDQDGVLPVTRRRLPCTTPVDFLPARGENKSGAKERCISLGVENMLEGGQSILSPPIIERNTGERLINRIKTKECSCEKMSPGLTLPKPLPRRVSMAAGVGPVGLGENVSHGATTPSASGSAVQSTKKRKDAPNQCGALDECLGSEEKDADAFLLDNRKCLLPTVPDRKNPDLNVLAPETMKQLLDGHYSKQLSGFKMIDCRFEYEYEGGHIDGALHLKDPKQVEDLLFKKVLPNSKSQAIIFHCEFSQNRAPKM